MSIAGFDPSGGAGLLADIKTFEQHKVYGLSLSTANTLQTEREFLSIQWTDLTDLLNAVDVFLKTYPLEVIKIGIVPSFDYLFQLVMHIKNRNAGIKIIVDPIIKSSTGFDFQNGLSQEKVISVLKSIFLLTPNIQEAVWLSGNSDAETAAKELAQFCNVLLKGGHSKAQKGVDFLYSNNNRVEIRSAITDLPQKHGSGCVLSAAIASNLTLGIDLTSSCSKAKKYVEQVLSSNNSLLGYHHV